MAGSEVKERFSLKDASLAALPMSARLSAPLGAVRSHKMLIFGDIFCVYVATTVRRETRRCFCCGIVCWCQVVHGNWKLINSQICVWDSLRQALLPYFHLHQASNKATWSWFRGFWIDRGELQISSFTWYPKISRPQGNNTNFALEAPTETKQKIFFWHLQKLLNKNNLNCHSAEKCANR